MDSNEDDCGADVNNDDHVDVNDIVSMVLAWGPCASCDEDVDDDGTVDVNDLVEIILAWGPCG